MKTSAINNDVELFSKEMEGVRPIHRDARVAMKKSLLKIPGNSTEESARLLIEMKRSVRCRWC
nr:hypothetical protein [Methylomarinum sp. Ch1-1]MDP4520441.1 hypothetical protein [Methylomarinum sp. Ch1-1]